MRPAAERLRQPGGGQEPLISGPTRCAASSGPLGSADSGFPDVQSAKLLSPLPVPKASTCVGDGRNHNGIIHEPIHNTVGIPPQQVLAMSPIAERPSIGSLDDVSEGSLNGFLKSFCRAFASGTVPIEGIFVILGRARQESRLSHAAPAAGEPGP